MTAQYSEVTAQMWVWMQTYQRRGLALHDHLDEAFSEVKAAGYDSIEGWLSWCATGEQTDRLFNLLQKHGLHLTALYAGGNYHDRQAAEVTVQQTLERAGRGAAINCPLINVNPDPLPAPRGEQRRVKTAQELATQAQYLNRLAQNLKQINLEFVLHHHDPEMQDGAREYRAMLQQTNSARVGICADLHWMYRGGQDPVTLLRETGSRVKSLHIRNSHNGIWSESLGDGDIDYRQISDVLNEIGYHGPLLVELSYDPGTEITRSLVENMRISREYVRTIFGV